jgi:MFS family permease
MALPLVALSMDVNGIGTVLPAIARSLDIGWARANLVVSASTVAFAVALLPAGYATYRWGHRSLLLLGVSALGLASLLCAVAPGLGVLAVGRALQGAAGAFCFTTSLAVVAAGFDEARRPAAIGAWGAISGVGAAAGPLVGGALVDLVSWRAFFVVTGGLALVSLPALWVLVGRRPSPSASEVSGASGAAPAAPWRWARLVALSAGLVLAIGATGLVARDGWASPTVAVTGAAGLALLGLVLWSGRRPGTAPLVRPTVRRAPLFGATGVAAFASTWGFGVTVVYAAVYLQDVRGYSALGAGGVFAVYCALFALAGTVVGPLVRRIGPARTLAPAMAVGTVGLAALALLGASTPLAVVVVALAVAGAGQGLCFDTTSVTALSGVEVASAGEASAVAQAFRLIGFSLGVTVSASVATRAALGLGTGVSAQYRAAMVVAATASLLGTAGAAVLARRADRRIVG